MIAITARQEWTTRAACATRDLSKLTEDSDPFFHPDGERGTARHQRAEAAKAICAACPVKAICEGEQPGEYGTWAGRSEDDRSGKVRSTGRRSGPKARPREHGTLRGYRQHATYGEQSCDDCRAALREREAARRAARREVAA